MQKRIFICLLLVIALLVPTLASCGFGGSDALEIENIGVEVLEDGTSKITIKYFDDIEDPVVFYVPAGQIGEKGDAGEIGNGIKEIVLIGNLTNIAPIRRVFVDHADAFGVHFIIPENAQFGTVIGAALSDME